MRPRALNLDATAANGIPERQGFIKVCHIDANVRWLQKQVAKLFVPLFRVDGSDNWSDLMTKRLTTAVQQKHVEYMQLEFRDGRAQKAAQLHSTQRAEPQGEVSEGGLGNRWEERGEDG